MGVFDILFSNTKRDELAQWVKDHDNYDYTGLVYSLHSSVDYDYMSISGLENVKDTIEMYHQHKIYRDAHPAPNARVGKHVTVYIYGKQVNGFPHVTDVKQTGDTTTFTRMLSDGTYKTEIYKGGGVTWYCES